MARTSDERPSWVYLHSSLTSVAQFTQWLAAQYNAGTPVTFIYPLATETTETVTGQTLTTVDGDNTLSIQASIENLPITANYTQKGGTVINWVGTNYYTKAEIQALIAAIPNFSIQVLQQLPQTGEELVLYFIPKNGTAPDVYDEYIWLEDDSSFELIGSTQVDLTGYATETWVQNQDYATESDIPTKTSDLTNDSNFATVSQIPTNNNQLTNGAGYITGISSSDVTTALGYTPYNSTNPAGYTDNIGTVTSVNNTQPDANGNVSITIPAAQVNSDWNAQSGVAQILNKPTIPTMTYNSSTKTLTWS